MRGSQRALEQRHRVSKAWGRACRGFVEAALEGAGAREALDDAGAHVRRSLGGREAHNPRWAVCDNVDVHLQPLAVLRTAAGLSQPSKRTRLHCVAWQGMMLAGCNRERVPLHGPGNGFRRARCSSSAPFVAETTAQRRMARDAHIPSLHRSNKKGNENNRAASR